MSTAWTGAPKHLEGRRERAKRHSGYQGSIRTGLSCYNCRKGKRKCQKGPQEACEWVCAFWMVWVDALLIPESQRPCLSRGLTCITPRRSFQGHRADLRRVHYPLLGDPVSLHEYELHKQATGCPKLVEYWSFFDQVLREIRQGSLTRVLYRERRMTMETDRQRTQNETRAEAYQMSAGVKFHAKWHATCLYQSTQLHLSLRSICTNTKTE